MRQLGTLEVGADECRGCLRNTRMWCGALATRAMSCHRRWSLHRLTMSRHIHGIHRLRARPGFEGLLSSCRPRGPPMGMMGMEMGELTLPTGLIRSIRRACTCASSLRTLTPGLPRACGVSAWGCCSCCPCVGSVGRLEENRYRGNSGSGQAWVAAPLIDWAVPWRGCVHADGWGNYWDHGRVGPTADVDDPGKYAQGACACSSWGACRRASAAG